MKPWFFRMVHACAFALLLLVGCADRADVTAPATPPVPPASAEGLLPLREILEGTVDLLGQVQAALLPAVLRLTPLLSSASATREIGPEGGELRAADVTLRIPPGALSRRTRITLTVPAGTSVQAHFTPRGLQFQKPVELIFGLGGTNGARAQDLVGAYFRSSILNGLIPALEVLPAEVVDGKLRFWITHFSRYAPARRGYTAAGG